MTDELKQWEYDKGYDKGYEDAMSVLDKIRERIELEKLGYRPNAGYYKAIVKSLHIIDKYSAKNGGHYVCRTHNNL